MGVAGDSEPTEGRVEGVRVPCRDANRRVWQALDLLEAQRRAEKRPSAPTQEASLKESTEDQEDAIAP